MTKVAVLGSGIIGLWTAEVLVRAGHEVCVVSRSGHESTTSAAAASVLVPLLPGDPHSQAFQQCRRWASETLDHVRRLAGVETMLEVIGCYELGLKGAVEYGFALSNLKYLDFAEFTTIELEPQVAGCDCAVRFDCYLCQAARFLGWLHGQLQALGVAFCNATLTTLDQVALLDATVVFNCLGYQTVFPDDELYPVTGQSMFIPAANQEPGFGVGAGEHAVFRHSGGIHIGAFFVRGEAAVSPRRELYERSVAFVRGPFPELCASVGIEPPEIDLSAILRVSVGVRPLRPSGPRVERDKLGHKILVHNYGHGAHGWTLGYGSAIEAVKLAGLL